MRDYFETTAESYFKHLTRDGIELAVAEANRIARITAQSTQRYSRERGATQEGDGLAQLLDWQPPPLNNANEGNRGSR